MSCDDKIILPVLPKQNVYAPSNYFAISKAKIFSMPQPSTYLSPHSFSPSTFPDVKESGGICQGIDWGFQTPAPLACGARWFFPVCMCFEVWWGAFPVQCGMFSSIPGLCSPDGKNIHLPPVLTTRNISGHCLPNVLWEAKGPLWEPLERCLSSW